MTPLSWSGDEHLRTAAIAGSRWLAHVQLWRPQQIDRLKTGDVETAVVLLSGTFDLIGGGTAWPARGARTTEFEGRPMAVFLPKQTEFRAERGQGEILLVAARQPASKPPEQGRAVFGTSPLLQLAGSGKAFDPNTGDWRPAETFPTSPESLPPRRMERIAVGAVTVERVIARDYKAATLSIDEFVLQQGQRFALGDLPAPPCDEVLVFVRAECETTFGTQTRFTKLHGDGAFVLAPDELKERSIWPHNERAYVLIAWAGKP